MDREKRNRDSVKESGSVALFFGSFNPIHNGHIEIARGALREGLCEEVWLVVSPQNPFKEGEHLLSKEARFAMAEKALADEERIIACDIEFSMPIPSYTIDTLKLLGQKYPGRSFSIIMGGDNLEKIEEWRDWEQIVANYPLIVYPRQGSSAPPNLLSSACPSSPSAPSNASSLPVASVPQSANITILELPEINISSTMIRSLASAGKPFSHLVPSSIIPDIQQNYRP